MTPERAADLIPGPWRRGIAELPGDQGPSGVEWLRSLPAALSDGLDQWGLTVDGDPMTGHTALAVPVVREGEPLVLKIVWPHPEATHEALALRVWGGRGSVRLVAADPRHGRLLLERLDHTRDLEDPAVSIDRACEVIGQLLARLHVPAPPQVRPLEEFLARSLEAMSRNSRVPRRVAERTAGLARELFASSGEPVLLHTDLHFGNVLAASREEWLAIDPKPLAGPRGYELGPALRNRAEELGSGSAFRWSVRHRVGILADAIGLDEDEARAWSVVHSGLQVHWCSADREEASFHLALMKALDD